MSNMNICSNSFLQSLQGPLLNLGIPTFKQGSDIHIKKKNRGKFTASAKAHGMGVQEYAQHVLNDPNATALQKKRANFARNAAKFKHANGGQFTFPSSALTKEAQKTNQTSKKRNPAIPKSPYPNYKTNRIRKGAAGLKFEEPLNFLKYTPAIARPTEFSEVLRTARIIPGEFTPTYITDAVVTEEVASPKPKKVETSNYQNSLGFAQFNRAFDKVVEEDPEAEKFRAALTHRAYRESRFNAHAKNAKAPAYGYFQFMQGEAKGKYYNNIKTYAGTSDIDEFLKDPVLQIKAAVKFSKEGLNGLSNSDRQAANEMNFSDDAIIQGLFLGGLGGVRKVLHKKGNPSDKHWSDDGKSGTTVLDEMESI